MADAKHRSRSSSRSNAANAVLATNRRALFEYEVLETHETGICLQGSEVKSIRDGKVSLTEAYAEFHGDELFLVSAHVAEYVMAHSRNHPPLRPRKLLLHRRELDKLHEGVSKAGLTIIPLRLYLKEGRIKVEIALCRGKKAHDKRATIKEREERRDMSRALRESNTRSAGRRGRSSGKD